MAYMGDELLSTEEAAQLLGKSRWTVARMVRQGKLQPAATTGTSYVFHLADIVKIREAVQ